MDINVPLPLQFEWSFSYDEGCKKVRTIIWRPFFDQDFAWWKRQVILEYFLLISSFFRGRTRTTTNQAWRVWEYSHVSRQEKRKISTISSNLPDCRIFGAIGTTWWWMVAKINSSFLREQIYGCLNLVLFHLGKTQQTRRVGNGYVTSAKSHDVFVSLSIYFLY